MTYLNVKSHKKTGFHPLLRRFIFGKTTKGVGGQIDLPNLSRVKRMNRTVQYAFKEQEMLTDS